MENIEMEIVENNTKLKIEIDLTKELGPSKSGKTSIIASTHGNISLPGFDDLKIGINLYKRRGA